MPPAPSSAVRPSARATAFGLVSVVLWGTSIAVNRLVVDGIGLLRGPLISTLLTGTIGVAILAFRKGELAKLRRLPARYWAVCGGIFVAYTLAYNLGVGIARNGRQLLLFAILNYLWPVLTVAFSVAIFGRRVRAWFFPGLLLAAGAIVLAVVARPDGAAGVGRILEDLRSNPLLYVLGLACGVGWGLFSNLGRKIAGASEANPIPVLFLAAGAAFAAAWLLGADRLPAVVSRPAHWNAATVSALAYRVLFVDLAAYAFWDAAMRRGSQILVAAASFFTPLLSTAAIAVIHGAAPGWLFWLACAMAIGGAALCRLSVRDG
jgi:drug/metabolite transporter (DMT)-like permease